MTKLLAAVFRKAPAAETPAGSRPRPVIHVNRDGTSTVPATELERIVLERFQEMDDARKHAPRELQAE